MYDLDESKKFNLTAIVLVYNGEPYLEECIHSLVNQTLNGLEILLINDASTDDSLSICKKFERDYDNVFVIDKEKNSGLVSSANLGIELARGEYVVLVDNDDIVPSYAYEKLYVKAKETNADISLGRAYLFNKYQRVINFIDEIPWKEEKVISNITEFPELFYDAFYWNKIIKKDFLIKNNIKMPNEIRVYADICFVHKAYVYAKKISIVPDCVYLWRQRDDSLSRYYYDVETYNDRINAYEINVDFISEFYANYFNTLFRRALIPIKGILYGGEFEKVFFDRILKLFEIGGKKVENIYENQFEEIDNIFAFLIINGYHNELKELLEVNLFNQNEIFNENGKSYWKLPQFRDSNLNIPDELFEIRYLQPQFINIDEIIVDDKYILFNNIELPKYFNLIKGEIVFKGRVKKYDIFENFISSFEIVKINNSEKNLFYAKIPLIELNLFEFYTIFFRFENEYGCSKDFNLFTTFIGNIHNNNEKINIFSSQRKKLIMTSQQLDDIFEIDCNEEELIIRVNNSDKIKKNIKIFLKNNTTLQKVFFDLNDSKTEYKLKWKWFLDENTEYTFFMRIFNNRGKLKKNVKITKNYIKNINDLLSSNYENFPVEFYVNKKNIVKLHSLK